MNINLSNFKHVHFVGIGGVSMYLLAIYCKRLGVEVSGSDINKSRYTKICEEEGINVYIGHRRKNIVGADLVVYTSAVDRSNIEIAESYNKGIKVIDRAELLSIICKNYKCVIGISGTHGKTTTCAMVYHILRECGKNVSCHIGADVVGARMNPEDDYLVLECCEYNRSFLKFDCDIGVVLNIDNDHLDCYQNMYNLRNAFRTFLKRADTRFVFDNPTTKCIKNKAIRIKSPCVLGLNKFLSEEKEYMLDNVYGEHNINNATVAVRVCEHLGLSYSNMVKALKSFTPAGRRCQKLGNIGYADIITDYAHHPSEILCLYNSLKLKYDQIYIIFQPHTYSRTRILIDDFVSVFNKIDNIFIYKEYPAREHACKGYSAKQLKDFVANAIYFKNYKHLKNWVISSELKNKSCVAFVGAGNINELGIKLVKDVNKRFK